MPRIHTACLAVSRWSHVGDIFDINVDYTSIVYVPNSSVFNFMFNVLIDYSGGVYRGAPPYAANVSSTFDGYVGPPIGFHAYASSMYGADAGFLGGQAPDIAFSATGLDSVLSIAQSDPNPIVYEGYGYAFGVPEPATWTLTLTGVLCLGAMLRSRRRLAAALPVQGQ